MANTILITANWHTGALSQQTISRQYDNNRYAVQFVGYPEASDGNKLDYYLLVWMSTAPGQKPGEITPIQLNSDQWYISNYFTQQVQVIKFQLCVLNEAGTYEAHSPIFSGRIGDSLEHDGTSQDIDVSTLFDAYREYVEELIIGAGAVIIDPTLTQSGQAADAKVVGDEIDTIKLAEPITIYFSDFEQGYRHGRTDCKKVVNATWVISKGPIEFKKGQVLQSEDSTLYEFSVVDPTPSNNGQVLVATRSANYTFTENITGYLEARLKSRESVTPETLNGKYFTAEQYELLKILNGVTDVTKKCLTYYVDGSSGSDSNPGTIDEPFATIQKAIDMGGENVLVSIGVYVENLQIKDKDKLRLMPYPTPSYDSAIGAPKIQIQKLYINNCRNVYISNFLIDNSSSWCFRCNNSYNVVVENCEAQNGILGGFLAYNSNIVFRNCTAHDIGDSTNYNSDGFNFHETGYSELYNCTAYDCVDDGISHHENTSGLISACTVYDCGSTVRGGGIAPTGNAEIKAANCIIHGCFRGFEAENLTKPAFLIGCVMYNNTTDCYVNNAQATLYGSKYTSVFGADNITILD